MGQGWNPVRTERRILLVIGGVTCFRDAHQSGAYGYVENDKRELYGLRYFIDKDDQHVEAILLTVCANQGRYCYTLNKTNEY